MNVEYDGISVRLGRKSYVIAPISLGKLKLLRKELTAYKEDLSEESIDTVIKSLFYSLQRNYPDITLEQVEEMIDVSNAGEIMRCVMDHSGMYRAKLEKEAAEKGKQADPDESGNPSPLSSGGNSTLESLPTLDIPLG